MERKLQMYGLFDSKTDNLIKASICHSIESVQGYAVWNFNASFDDIESRGLFVVPVTLTYDITPQPNDNV